MRAARRCCFVSLIIVASWLIVGCGDNPPEKEIQQAETAIDAARAAGAETYSKIEFAAVQEALKNAHAAVDARDYRLALNRALDARDRAQTAAREAAERKAAARSDADRALRNAALLVIDVRIKLKSPPAAHRPPRVLAAARKRAAESDSLVQEARTTFERGDYPTVLEMLAAPSARLRESIRELEGNDAPPPKRGR